MEEGKRTLHLMGTIIDLTVESDASELILDTLEQRLKIYEHRFSANDNHSELMKINLKAGKAAVQVHPDLYQLIKIGKENSCASESNLNIAIGPLVQTWRIGFTDAQVPSDETIQSLLKRVNPENIILDDATHSVFLQHPGMLIDLGALAKGYIADLLVDYLKEQHVHAALINLGGNVITLGPADNHADKNWRIGIRKPQSQRDQYSAILAIHDQSVVTSGIYERTLIHNGKSYHHLLDSHTGYPLETNVASLSIISDSSLDGEIWTTRLFGKSTEKILEIINQLPNIEVLILTQENQHFYSEGLYDKIVSTAF